MARSRSGAKAGRNKVKCELYAKGRVRAKNKARRIRKLYGDEAASAYLAQYESAARYVRRKGSALKKAA